MICASTHRAALARSRGRTGAQPGEDRQVVGVHAELAGLRRPRPGVLGAGVQRRPGQVEPDRRPGGVDGLGLEPGQQPQRLRVALEAAARSRQLVQRVLAVVAERRVAEVVGQRGGLGDVRLRPERPGQVPGHLGDLEAVGEPVADEVVHLRPVHLGLGGQPPRRRRVDDAGPVALVRRALGRLHPLGRLLDEPLAVVRRRTARCCPSPPTLERVTLSPDVSPDGREGSGHGPRRRLPGRAVARSTVAGGRGSWTEHSGLPGPRGNIELALAVADLGDDDLYDELIASDDEYRTFCGVGAVSAPGRPSRRSPTGCARLASDDGGGCVRRSRWRCNGSAIWTWRPCSRSRSRGRRTRTRWSNGPPRRGSASRDCWRRRRPPLWRCEVCRRATVALAGRHPEERRDPHVRTLRQALGYCWSVAVAAEPVPGLAAFRALDDTDPDVAWIVRTNLAKKRLSRLV